MKQGESKLDKAIRKVVIVGRDAAAWLTALALQLEFARGDAALEVHLVELPARVRPQDVFVTLPSQQAFHRILGLEEGRVLAACSGTYALAQRYSNWSGAAPAFLHAYDSCGVSLNNVDFFQFWLKARNSGMPVALEEFSLGAAAAKLGRFLVFNEESRDFSNATYGYHLDAIPYLQGIGKTALRAGLKHTVAEQADVQHDGERIQSIRLQDGATIEADLFIDASGPEGALISQLEQRNFDAWSDWLPCDRMLSATAPGLSPAPSFSQISAFRAGWLGIYPLANRTGVVAAYSSAEVDDEEALRLVAEISGLRIAGSAVATAFRPGARRRQWIGNCLAIGESAVNLGPLDAVQMNALHTGISYLVSLFPVDAESLAEATIFNEKMASHTVGMRDFQIAHFKLNKRFDEPFWDAAREGAVPDSLAEKMRLFAARGIVAMNENETFQEDNWTTIFNGHRLLPETWNPLVDRVPEQEQIETFQTILKFVAAEADKMPTMQSYLELNAPQATGDYAF